jgi:hypothetical protein
LGEKEKREARKERLSDLQRVNAEQDRLKEQAKNERPK